MGNDEPIIPETEMFHEQAAPSTTVAAAKEEPIAPVIVKQDTIDDSLVMI